MTTHSNTLPRLTTTGLRSPATLCIALFCVLQLASCMRAQDPSPVSPPTSAQRQPPPPPERCTEVPVPVAVAVCG